MTTNYVVADGLKRKPTAEEWEVLLTKRIPEIIRRYKDGGLDPVGVNDTLQQVADGVIITNSKMVITTAPKAKPEKFQLLADLGVITVPADYVHPTQLASFMKKNRKKFYSVNDDITDANFPNPTRILKPGDKLALCAFEQIASGTTTSEERMGFLARQNAVYTGAQGASLVFEQKRDQLPKDKWYASFDEKDRLWEDSYGYHRVPEVNADTDGDFIWNLGHIEAVWNDNDAFLCFRDLSEGEHSGT
jgi:hypothetical protein